MILDEYVDKIETLVKEAKQNGLNVEIDGSQLFLVNDEGVAKLIDINENYADNDTACSLATLYANAEDHRDLIEFSVPSDWLAKALCKIGFIQDIDEYSSVDTESIDYWDGDDILDMAFKDFPDLKYKEIYCANEHDCFFEGERFITNADVDTKGLLIEAGTEFVILNENESETDDLYKVAFRCDDVLTGKRTNIMTTMAFKNIQQLIKEKIYEI